MKYSELEKKLRKAGCYPIDNSDHPIWYKPNYKENVQNGASQVTGSENRNIEQNSQNGRSEFIMK